MNDRLDEIRRVLPDVRRELLELPNVVATGIGHRVTEGEDTGELCIVCSVTHKVAERYLAAGALVPAELGGIGTDVRATGPIAALQARTDRVRPAPGGVSLGHPNVTAGTLGCLVERDGELHLLSNNHVMANSNDAAEGDPVLQPGPADGGRAPGDRIARLADFVPLAFEDEGGAENRVDAAIARPGDPADVEARILQVGTPEGVAEGTLGTYVRKSGRTTGLTTGTIQQIDVTVRVSYGPDRVATFADQLVAGPMSQGGDSGSAVVDAERHLVGLLFAGSPNTTVLNRATHVLESLDVSLPGG